MIIYVLSFIVIISVYIVWGIIGANFVKCFRELMKLKSTQENNHKSVEFDFYQCVNYRTLKMELEDTFKSKKITQKLRDKK